MKQEQILDSSKLKEFADDNFEFDGNSSVLQKGSNFSFSDCVLKGFVLQTHKNQGLIGKGLVRVNPRTKSIFGYVFICVPVSVKSQMYPAKNIDSCQSAFFVQADMFNYFLLLENFLPFKVPLYLRVSWWLDKMDVSDL